MTSGDPHPVPSDPSPRDPDMSPALRQALAYLAGEGRARSPELLLQGLRERFREAGREKLADLVYEMAKACLSRLSDCSLHVDMIVRPRQTEVISGEMQTMNACLENLAGGQDLGTVTRREPSEAQAMEDADRCLAVLHQLEGDSDRHQLARALLLVHEDRPREAEPLVRPIMEDTHKDEMIRRAATANLAFSLFRQGRSAEVVPLVQDALQTWPDRPPLYFNLISAAAATGDRALFEDGVRKLCALHRAQPSTLIASWIDADLVDMAGWLDMDATELSALTAQGPGGSD